MLHAANSATDSHAPSLLVWVSGSSLSLVCSAAEQVLAIVLLVEYCSPKMLPAADIFLTSVARAYSAAIATGSAVALLVRDELLTLLPAAVSAENGEIPVLHAAADKAQAIALLVRNDPPSVLPVVYSATDSHAPSLAASVSCVPHLRPRLHARMAFRRAGSDFRWARPKDTQVEMDVVAGVVEVIA